MILPTKFFKGGSYFTIERNSQVSICQQLLLPIITFVVKLIGTSINGDWLLVDQVWYLEKSRQMFTVSKKLAKTQENIFDSFSCSSDKYLSFCTIFHGPFSLQNCNKKYCRKLPQKFKFHDFEEWNGPDYHYEKPIKGKSFLETMFSER